MKNLFTRMAALLLVAAMMMVCFAGCGAKEDAGTADVGTTDATVDTGAEDAGGYGGGAGRTRAAHL